MGGVDNLRGIDYQISYTVYRILLELSRSEQSVDSFEIESLNDASEDFNIYYKDGKIENIQIKKRNEEYHWTPSDFKPIFKKFIDSYARNLQFTFVTNGSGNEDVKKLKNFIDDGLLISDALLHRFCAEAVTINEIKNIIGVTKIFTRAFSSDVDANPAKILKDEIRSKLSRPPFFTKLTADQALDRVWNYVFDCAKSATKTSIEDVEKSLQERGIFVRPPAWRKFPLPNPLIVRDKIIFDLTSILNKNKVVIVYGISGSGKSASLAHLASEMYNNNQAVCWINIDQLTSVEYITKLIGLSLSHFLYFNDANDVSVQCDSDDDYADKIAEAIISVKLVLIFDSINSGSKRVQYIVKRVITILARADALGKIIVSSTDVSAFSTLAHALNNNGIAPYLMPALGIEEFKDILSDAACRFSDEEIEDLKEIVGGHYLSTLLLKEIITNNMQSPLVELKRRGALGAQTWLMTEIIQNLDENFRNLLLACSVFDYDFEFEIAEEFNQSDMSASVIFMKLASLGLVRFGVNECSLHDSVRPIVYEMLSKTKKIFYNEKAFDHYKARLEETGNSQIGFQTEIIMKWGRHLENLSKVGKFFGKSKLISELTARQLDMIWSIQRFGFPFHFHDDENMEKDDDEQFSKLIEIGIVSPAEKGFAIQNIEIFDMLYIIYLCRNYNISDALGYIPDFRPNHAFKNQGLICEWQHCIEFMPFPPRSRQSYLDHKQHIRTSFEKGKYKDLTPEHINFLQGILEEPIPGDAVDGDVDNLEYGGCPIFGHCCPGGAAQARICAAEIDQETSEEAGIVK